MTRLDATRILVEVLDHGVGPAKAGPYDSGARDGNTPIIASLGHPAYDLFAVKDRGANFYQWGSMGLASSMGLGLALARPDLRVFVADGDGSLLMNLGSLATIGWSGVANLVVIVWDNGEYGTTGGQQTATAHGADLAAAAISMRITETSTARNEDEFRAAVVHAQTARGPIVIVAKVNESAPTTKPPLDCVFIKQRFMSAIGSPEAGTIGTALKA